MKKIAILGGGESGVGAALLAKSKGYDVWLSDNGRIADKFKNELASAGLSYEENGHTAAIIFAAGEIVKSPGIPDTIALLLDAQKRAIPVISEIEFAARFARGKIIGITGTNGKTTTAMLTYHLLKVGGINVKMGGNIGNSFARLLLEQKADWYVLELSSFQLDGIQAFRPDIAVLLNITPDHLDRYDFKMENYVQSKFRIAMNQSREDIFIFNATNSTISEYLKDKSIRARQLAVNEVPGNEKILKIGDAQFDLTATKLRGPHNFFNAACAIRVAVELGVPEEKIQAGLDSFPPVPHRLEPVATIDGVEYINDSKATNVNAVYYALQAFDGPIVWIVGGQDKGNDYRPLAPLVKNRVKGIVCLGLHNEKVKDFFSELCPQIVETHTAQAAVNAASQMARDAAVVLLSPACASFDLFKNYEDRGVQFKNAVFKVKEENSMQT